MNPADLTPEQREAEFKKLALELSHLKFVTGLTDGELKTIMAIEAAGTGINIRRYGKQWTVRFYLGGKARYWAFCSDAPTACRIADLLKWRTKDIRVRSKSKGLTEDSLNLGLMRCQADNKMEGAIVSTLLQMQSLLPEPKQSGAGGSRKGVSHKTARSEYAAQMVEIKSLFVKLHNESQERFQRVVERLAALESQQIEIISRLNNNNKPEVELPDLARYDDALMKKQSGTDSNG